jgi:hypothetical protein
MKDCKFNPPTNGKKGFHYVIKNGRPHLLTRKDLKDLPKDAIAFKLPSDDGSRKLRMKAQAELVQGLASGVLPMSWELQPSRGRVYVQGVILPSEFGDSALDEGILALDTFNASGFNLLTNTKYDVDGFDAAGFNKDGFNRRGFDRAGRYFEGEPYSEDGYSIAGYLEPGFYDPSGFDKDGYNEEGYDEGGFDRRGVHKVTGSRRSDDPAYLEELQHQGRYVLLAADGRDYRGFNAFGVNSPVDELWPGEKRGFSRHGQFGSDSPVIDASLMLAHDENGFDAYGIHRESRSWLVKRTAPDGGDVWVDAWGRTWMSDARPRDNRGFDIQGTLANGSRVDSRGFNAFCIHEETRAFADERGLDLDGDYTGLEGYDFEGYDDKGYDYDGFDRDGFHRDTQTEFDKDGYDMHGLNKDGLPRAAYENVEYDTSGFNSYGLHRNGTPYNDDGYDVDGYYTDGFNEQGFDRGGYGRDGYDERGFDLDGVHKVTGTWRAPDGWDVDGYYTDGFNADGYDRRGSDRSGFSKSGFDADGYDEDGYDRKGLNRNGFDRKGLHHMTSTEYDREGYDYLGLDKDGFDSYGYDRNDFDKSRIHRYTDERFDEDGFDADGYDSRGFNEDHLHRYTETEYDREGYDYLGFDREGVHKERRQSAAQAATSNTDSRSGDPVPHNLAGHDWYGPTPQAPK